jgi:hypothetical protein
MRLIKAGAGIAAFRLFHWRSERDHLHAGTDMRSLIMIRLLRLSAALLAGAVLTGCATSATIQQIRTDPGRYQHKSVSVSGTVNSSVGTPLVPVQFYTLSDGTGEINVVAARSTDTPARGAHVRVKGRVNTVATFGNRSLGLHLQEESRKRTD